MPVSRMHPARSLELRGRRVDADGARAAAREHRGEVRGAAAELDDVEPGDVAEHSARLGDVEHAPVELVGRATTARRPRSVNSRSSSSTARRSPRRGRAQPSSSAENQSATSRSRGLRRVGAVDEVVRHRHREVAADRARLGVGRVRRADRLAHRRDRAFALDDERPRRPRGDEVDELAEERLLPVLGVVRLAELAARGEQLARRDVKPRASMRPRISAARRRRTASGLIRMSVRSTAIGRAE